MVLPVRHSPINRCEYLRPEYDVEKSYQHLCVRVCRAGGFTVVLKWCYSGVAMVLLLCSNGVSMVSEWCWNGVRLVLEWF
jgi:hypothetical protein